MFYIKCIIFNFICISDIYTISDGYILYKLYIINSNSIYYIVYNI